MDDRACRETKRREGETKVLLGENDARKKLVRPYSWTEQ